MTSDQIYYLIHSKCKNRGEHCFGELNGIPKGGRLDAWSIKGSWGKDQITGYEIKVDRHDFVQDDKWVNYLDTCNYFYFVCPTNLIKLEEVPEQAGLYYVGENCKILSCKKKAPYRVVKLDSTFLLGLIINRLSDNAKEKNRVRTRQERVQDALQELADAKTATIYGREYGKRMSIKMGELQQENRDLITQNAELNDVKKFMETAGVKIGSNYSWNTYTNKLIQKIKDINREFAKHSEVLGVELQHADMELGRIRGTMDLVHQRLNTVQERLAIIRQEEGIVLNDNI